jgi:predicted N-formylglutamate amidohydrolase
MAAQPPYALLDPDEPPAFTIARPHGRSPFFLACDHAGRLIPRRLGDLGVSAAERERHIAWDIGGAGVALELAERLDAFAILQTYSRLVIDCNRDPGVPSAMPEVSELTEIPGNAGLSEADRAARVAAIHAPYHDRIRAELDRRHAEGRLTVLVAVHSFTPVFKGVARRWHAGVLYNRDPSFPHLVLDLLRREGDLEVGDNEPYRVSDATDYTIPVHGERRGLPHVELEIRQDLIANPAGQVAWAVRLERVLKDALRLHAKAQG